MTHRAKRVKVFCFFFSKKKALLFEKRRIASCDRESKNFYPFLPC
jgi:hypothetical protein